ncbi:MAG: hypothetical protein JW797_03250 [Bradymonadales bacterium]|nr:hypothetical protein [Bradymonadales bacterium]
MKKRTRSITLMLGICAILITAVFGPSCKQAEGGAEQQSAAATAEAVSGVTTAGEAGGPAAETAVETAAGPTSEPAAEATQTSAVELPTAVEPTTDPAAATAVEPTTDPAAATTVEPTADPALAAAAESTPPTTEEEAAEQGTAVGATSSAVTRIVFVDRQGGCACNRRRIDASWTALQTALDGRADIAVERLFSDTNREQVAPFQQMRAILTIPAIYFLDSSGGLVEVLQGQVTSQQVAALLP